MGCQASYGAVPTHSADAKPRFVVESAEEASEGLVVPPLIVTVGAAETVSQEGSAGPSWSTQVLQQLVKR